MTQVEAAPWKLQKAFVAWLFHMHVACHVQSKNYQFEDHSIGKLARLARLITLTFIVVVLQSGPCPSALQPLFFHIYLCFLPYLYGIGRGVKTGVMCRMGNTNTLHSTMAMTHKVPRAILLHCTSLAAAVACKPFRPENT